MKKFLLITFLACFAIIFPVMAQQTPEPTPIFPPNPEDIFAEGINWVLVESQSTIATPEPTESIPVCADQFPQQDTRRGQWHIVYNAEIEKVVVCFDETLATYDILPEGHGDWRVYGNPNNEWLIIIGRNFDGAGAYQIYSHHLATSQQNFLGEKRMSIDTAVGVDDWLTDTLGVMYSSIYNYSSPIVSYYRFDVTTPNSLEFVLSGGEFNRNLIKIDSPKRYIAFYSGGEFSNGHGNCSLVILDATGITYQEIGYECFPQATDELRPFYLHNESIIYYLVLDGEDDMIASLQRYDTRYLPDELIFPENLPFGEGLFWGEIEAILGVSPDEKQVAVILDDDNEFNYVYFRDYRDCLHYEETWRVAIIKPFYQLPEYEPGGILHHTEPIGVCSPSQVAWLDEETVVIQAYPVRYALLAENDGGFHFPNTPSSLRRISFEENGVNIAITTQQ